MTAVISGEQGKRRMPEGRRFQKGQSGNPSGQPKAIAELRSLARGHTQLSVDTLVAAMRGKKVSWPAKVAAAREMLNRGWGQPQQVLEINDNRPLAQVPAGDLVAAVLVLAQAKEHSEG